MSCSVCDTLPIKRVRVINRHLQEGKKSLLAIAKHYKVDPGELRNHMVGCLQNNVQDDEELARSQRQITAIITQLQEDIANGEHLRSDEDYDGGHLMRSYLSAMREHRETILARQKLRTPDEVYQDLRENVVDPLINAMIAICIDESRRLREEVFSLTQNSSAQHPKIKKSVDEMLERVADRMSTEAIHDIPSKVRAVVGKQKQRPATKH